MIPCPDLRERAPEEPLQVLQIGAVVHVRWTLDYSEAVFLGDLAKVPALAMFDTDQQRTARETRYMRDLTTINRPVARNIEIQKAVRRMCFEHECTHSLLARARNLPHSPVLWDVAHNKPTDRVDFPAHYQEEAEVLALQRYLNTGDHNDDPKGILSALAFEFSISDFRRQALSILRGE